jgi:hypothetical protein
MGGLIGKRQRIFNAEAVASTASVYCNSIKLRSSDAFGLWIQATSAGGAPDIKVELEQSYTTPTTEGSSDTNYVEPEGVSDIFASLTAETAKIKQITPVPMEYMRIKITGNAANPADTVVTAYLYTQDLM